VDVVVTLAELIVFAVGMPQTANREQTGQTPAPLKGV
jgi:hypothetical protein